MELFGFGKPNVEKMKGARDLKGLTKTLEHGEYQIRKQAAEALLAFGASSVPVLLPALESQNENARIHASWVLALLSKNLETLDSRLKDQLVQTLIQATRDNSPIVRQNAVAALEWAGDDRAVAAVLDRLGDAQQKVRINAVTAIGQLCTRSRDPELRASALLRLAARLRGESAEVRASVLGVLVELLKTRAPPDLRLEAQLVTPLIPHLLDDDLNARKAAFAAVLQLKGTLQSADQQLKDQLSWSAILAPAGNETALLRSAVSLLELTWEEGAFDRFTDRVRKEGESQRRAALINLGRLYRSFENSQFREAVFALAIRFLDDREASVRNASVQALCDTGSPQAILALMGVRDAGQRKVIVAELTARRDHVVRCLVEELKSCDAPRCKLAACMLSELGWVPDTDELGAFYSAGLGDLNPCAKLYERKAGQPDLQARIAQLFEGMACGAGSPAIGLDRILVKIRFADLDKHLRAGILDGLKSDLWCRQHEVRARSAQTLVTIYRQEGLSESDKHFILASRERITAPHTSTTDHTDEGSVVHADNGQSHDCHHEDSGYHTDGDRHEDRGIGVDFPL